jgi:hypothetical protein
MNSGATQTIADGGVFPKSKAGCTVLRAFGRPKLTLPRPFAWLVCNICAPRGRQAQRNLLKIRHSDPTLADYLAGGSGERG